MNRGMTKLCAGVALLSLAVALPNVVVAQETPGEQQISVSIPPQRLSDALRQLAETSHLQLFYDAKIAEGKTAPGVSGTMTSRAAIAQLLAGSGLGFKFTADGTVTIAAVNPDVRAVGVVNVEGVGSTIPNGDKVTAVNGINGSTDVEATENTGSYTTGATSMFTKDPLSLRETPASISTLTSQRLQDQALTSVRDVMDALPGISTETMSSTDFTIYSRGFRITQISFDGGSPLGFQYGNRPVIDLSEYDNVQLVRGANGVLGGYDDPGGSLNFQRKRPLDHFQLKYDQELGSWNHSREVLDVTKPISHDGRLKARASFAKEDSDYYYKYSNIHKYIIYGALEYDFAPATILNVGGSYISERNVANSSGLPLYSDGTRINFPVSTCLCEPNNFDDAVRREFFVNFEHKFNENLSTHLKFTYNFQRVNALYSPFLSAVQPGATPENSTPDNGKAVGLLQEWESNNGNKTISIDYTVNGKAKFFGLDQTFFVGLSYNRYDGPGTTSFYPSYGNPFVIPDIFAFDPSTIHETGPAYLGQITTTNRVIHYSGYFKARLAPIKWLPKLHIVLGDKISGYTDTQVTLQRYGSTSDFTSIVTPTLKDKSHSSLEFGGTYDILKNLSLYGGRQLIYQPQTTTRYGGSLVIPPPVTGENDQLGLNWESTGKLFNASLALFSTVQNGYLASDFNNPGSNIPIIQDNKSKGFEVEFSGQLIRDLQVSGSYTYNDAKVVTQSGTQPINSFLPKSRIKTFVTYRPGGWGLHNRLILGGGFQWQSGGFTAGSICADVPYSITCPDYNYKDVNFTTNGHATGDLKVGYKINDHMEFAVNVKNFTNVKAWELLLFSNVNSYNYYVTPRNILASLNAKW